MSKVLILTVALAAILTASGLFKVATSAKHSDLGQDFEAAREFTSWSSQTLKRYNTVAEKNFRFMVFKNNLKIYEAIKDQNLGFETTVGKFADLTHQEFLAQYTGLIDLSQYENRGNLGTVSKKFKPTSWKKYYNKYLSKSAKSSLGQAMEIDWNLNNKMGRVRNQGKCGSCYSFTSAIVAQSHYSLNKGVPLIEFSEQHIMDCSKPYGNNACNGGLNDASLQFLADVGAIPRSKYPYSATHNEHCRHSTADAIRVHNSYTTIPAGRGDLMVSALQKGPLAGEMDSTVLKHYKSGIIQNVQGVCSTTPNHAVIVFGVGSFSGGAYWKVRNTWGEDWGENGDFRILAEMSGNGVCAISRKSSLPVYL